MLAGAGSGKTRVLTTRIWHLVTHHGVSPERILAVTFTNKAAGEMRERVATMLGGDPRGIWMGTFHAVGARLLRRHAPELGWTRSFAIRDAEQSLREVKRAQTEARIDVKRWSPKAVRACISDAKNRLIGPGGFEEEHADGPDLLLRRVARVYPLYQAALRTQDAMDFDDLLLRPVQLLEAHQGLLAHYRERFAFILVDEYQDTNRAQFRLLELLAGEHRNLMVVGDDDQSIYGWRGADIGNILDFEDSFPGASVVRLEQNYRSTPVILDAANQVIRENRFRKEKTMRTERRGGTPISLLEAADENDEARWIVEEVERKTLERPELDYRDFAVLYRTNAQARALEDRFTRRGVPYQVVGGVRFYERREIQDVVAYLRLIANPRDIDAFNRVVNYPRRGVGKVSLERLAAFAATEQVGLLEAAAEAGRIGGLSAGARNGLRGLAELIRRHAQLAMAQPAGEVLESLIAELNLVRTLMDEEPEGADRAGNVGELVAAAHDFEAGLLDLDEGDRDAFTDLGLFLQHIALVADIDAHDAGADAVTLMTVHSAKGLEFPVVFIGGLEEGLFPLMRAYDEEEQLEEERRLLYVAMTRAREELFLTHAQSRRRAGEVLRGERSSFLGVLGGQLRERRTDRVRAARRWSGGAGRGGRMGGDGGSSRWRRRADSGESFNQDRPSFAKGERVVHKTFGSGVIVELSGFGADLKVTVDFTEAGRKKLLVRYASLERDSW